MTTPTVPFNYSGDPSSSIRDEVRFQIQDTDGSCPLLSDVELDYIIDKWFSLYQSAVFCASVAAATIARKWARVVTIGDSGTTANVGDLQARYTAMAMQLRNEYEDEGAVGGLVNLENILLGNDFDPTIDPLEFAMRLDDNMRAGNQSWGGELPSTNPGSWSDVANDGIVSGSW